MLSRGPGMSTGSCRACASACSGCDATDASSTGGTWAQDRRTMPEEHKKLRTYVTFWVGTLPLILVCVGHLGSPSTLPIVVFASASSFR